MKTVETKAIVTGDGKLTAEVPASIKAGKHNVVIVINEDPAIQQAQTPLDFPVDQYGAWPSDLSLSREDLYGDNGR